MFENNNNTQDTNSIYDINKTNGPPPRDSPIARMFIIPLTGFLGMLAGAIVFYFMANKIDRNIDTQKKNTKIILNFLTEHERAIIETLIKNNGNAFQYELNRISGLTRVKTHRIIQNLEEKGIIHKETYGKVNKIILNSELYEVLK